MTKRVSNSTYVRIRKVYDRLSQVHGKDYEAVSNAFEQVEHLASFPPDIHRDNFETLIDYCKDAIKFLREALEKSTGCHSGDSREISELVKLLAEIKLEMEIKRPWRSSQNADG